MRKFINTMVISTALLAGCASFENTVPVISQNPLFISVKQEDFTNPFLHGTALFYPSLNLCVITLRRYPLCLAHELRHCLEGAWHGFTPSMEDC